MGLEQAGSGEGEKGLDEGDRELILLYAVASGAGMQQTRRLKLVQAVGWPGPSRRFRQLRCG